MQSTCLNLPACGHLSARQCSRGAPFKSAPLTTAAVHLKSHALSSHKARQHSHFNRHQPKRHQPRRTTTCSATSTAIGVGIFFTPSIVAVIYAYFKGKGNVKDGLSRLLTEVTQGYFQPNVGGESIPVAQGELSDLAGDEPLFKALYQWSVMHNSCMSTHACPESVMLAHIGSRSCLQTSLQLPCTSALRMLMHQYRTLQGGRLLVLVQQCKCRFLDSGGVYKLAFGPKAFIVVPDPVVVRHLLKVSLAACLSNATHASPTDAMQY